MAKEIITIDEEEEMEVIPTGYNADGDVTPHEGRRFCMVDPKCGCHEDPDLIAEVNQEYMDGLLSAEDATRTVRGDTL